MANGVLHVKYLDDRKVTNMNGLAIHIFNDIKDYCFLTEGLSLLKIELNDQGRDVIYIPMSNVALIEYFKSKEDFERVYPRRR